MLQNKTTRDMKRYRRSSTLQTRLRVTKIQLFKVQINPGQGFTGAKLAGSHTDEKLLTKLNVTLDTIDLICGDSRKQKS